jgi:hypothetical protein
MVMKFGHRPWWKRTLGGKKLIRIKIVINMANGIEEQNIRA